MNLFFIYLDLFEFLKQKNCCFYRALTGQLTRHANDVLPCGDVYTCHMAHNVRICVCGARMCACVYAFEISGLSILFRIFAKPT